MKKNYLLVAIALLFTEFVNAQSAKFPDALSYLNHISKENVNISKNVWRYTRSVAHSKSARSVENKRNVLIKTIETSIKNLENNEVYAGEEGFKRQVLDYWKLYRDMLKEDYAKIVDMKEIAEQSYDMMEAYILTQEKTDEKMQQAQETLEANVEAYANRNNIELIYAENDLSKKMKISNEVFAHKNEIDLIFFKSHFQEKLLMDALTDKDMVAAQQYNNALGLYAKEGMETLPKVLLYKNDKSLVNATAKMFDFYSKESEASVPQLFDFFILNDKMETLKSTLDKTPPAKRTKEQINEYNNLVGQFNKAVANYNKINTQLNKERQVALTAYNNAVSNFLATHIPKD